MKVLLVSRNSFFTSALGAVLEQDGIRFAVSVEDFLTLCRCGGNASGAADVLVVDMGEGLSEVVFRALSKLHQDKPRLRSLLVVPGFDAAQLARIFACGPAGCVQSCAPLSTFPQYIRLAAEGQRVLPDGAADVLHRLVQSTRPLASLRAIQTGLTQRETQVLGQLLRGAPNKEIAHALSVPLTTVKSDVKSIMQKTGAANRTALAVSAVQAGLGKAEQSTLHYA
ncbi:response regulator transcription factor [Phaeobacter sp. B1627]|uniref:helix-turn-helix transcriptional regulator n=1 Tax=Phaeobacter sp. B1627 TaxID=2583809 RepID=UPI0011181396|nr:response regulator transcription factor [Phaeobacter sp. B1627]TNJ40618.1 response regulator transcription factor [Phaeobacter sp. B1627]